MRDWTPDERFVAARYHCYRFGNCTKSETRNRSRATKITKAFTEMGRSKIFGDLTLGEYVTHAEKVHINAGKTPWFEPWRIKGLVEFDTPGAA